MHFNVFDKFEKSGFTFNKDKSLWAQTLCEFYARLVPQLIK